MNFIRHKKFKIFVGVFLILVTTGFSCRFITPKERELLQPITLTWWGTEDESGNFSQLIADYRLIHPNVTINYRRLREEEFEIELLEALAEDRGPDIIAISNDAVGKYLSKLEPLPSSTTMAYEITQRSLGIKKETVIEVQENISLTPAQLREQFVDVVFQDVVRNGQIYGLPLSVDTLVLFYNRDLLNNAGIPLPPTDWLKLQENVKNLTFQNQAGALVQSGVALGTADNVEHVVDILSLLMMQNGAAMTSGNNVTFGVVPANQPDRNYNPGQEAIRFYTDFANAAKEVYTWSDDFPNSLDAFAQGTVALMFGYNKDIAELEAKRQGKLNYGITSMPQIEGRPEINYANYQVHAVSNKSKNINASWDFIQFIAEATEAKKYLEKTKKPTALRSLINEQLLDEDLRVFTRQILTAKNWYTGSNNAAMKEAIKEMIRAFRGGQELRDAVMTASLKIRQTL